MDTKPKGVWIKKKSYFHFKSQSTNCTLALNAITPTLIIREKVKAKIKTGANKINIKI
jgi:hypothetical protein